MNYKSKFETLMESEGYTDEIEFLEEECMGFGMRLGVPAICMNEECDFITDMEPDQGRGWCPVCKSNTVKSALILAGIM